MWPAPHSLRAFATASLTFMTKLHRAWPRQPQPCLVSLFSPINPLQRASTISTDCESPGPEAVADARVVEPVEAALADQRRLEELLVTASG